MCYTVDNMTKKSRLFWGSLRPLIGQMVGVGLFTLPFALSQAGVGLGLIAIILAALASLVSLLMFGDIALALKGHHRFVGLMRELTGPVGQFFAAIGLFGGIFGALTAYVLIGGNFAYNVFAGAVPMSLFAYRLIFFVLAAILMLGGSLTVARCQKYLILVYGLGTIILVILTAPHLNLAHFVFATGHSWTLPFGAALFAFTGFAAIPEMRDTLGKYRTQLPRAITTGLVLVAVLYIIFGLAIVGVTGLSTSPDTLRGLQDTLGPLFVGLASLIGLATVLTAFVSQALVLQKTLLSDYRWRYFISLTLVLAVPLVLFLLGAADITRVISLTGGVFVGLAGLVLTIAYANLRRHPALNKRHLLIPRWLTLLTAGIFILNIILAL